MAKKETIDVVVPSKNEFYTCETTGGRVHRNRVHAHTVGYYHWNTEKGYQGLSMPQHFSINNEGSKDLHNEEIDNVPDQETIPWAKNPDGSKWSLPNNLPSKCCLSTCNKSLDTDWHQVAVSYNCRGHESLVGHAYWDLPEFNGNQVWFCSLDHAKQGAHILMDKLDDLGYAEPEEEEEVVKVSKGFHIVGPKG